MKSIKAKFRQQRRREVSGVFSTAPFPSTRVAVLGPSAVATTQMEAAALLVFALSLFSLCSVCPGCALIIEPVSSAETDKNATAEIESQLSPNDTAAEILALANSSIEDFENRTDAFLNDSPTVDEFLVGCTPDSKPGVCRENLLEICRPISGVYRCACPENVSRSKNGKCTVFNECMDKNFHNCSAYAICEDLLEGYTCRCKDGYRDAAEVENTLRGRVCVSLHWVVNGRKIGVTSERASVSDGGPLVDRTSLLPAISQTQETVGASQNESANLTELDTNDIFDDAPLSNEAESNFSIGHHAPFNGTRGSNFTFSNASANFTSLLFTVAPKSVRVGGRDGLPRLDPSKALNGGTLKEVFAAFDSDGDELISFWELKTAVDRYRIRLTDSDVRQMIKVADLSGEGVVDFGEFSTLMRRAS